VETLNHPPLGRDFSTAIWQGDRTTCAKMPIVPAADATKRLVLARSGNHCAFPSCGTEITTGHGVSAVMIGEIAHIAGEKPNSARYDPNMTDAERNAEDNLLALCPTHHTVIDTQEWQYSTPFLRQRKQEHEQAALLSVKRQLASVDFRELDVVAKAFTQNNAGLTDPSFALTKLAAKIAKNQLTDVQQEIQMGLSRASVVHGFIAAETKNQSGFSEKLKAGFQAHYARSKYIGLAPSEVFIELVDIARATGGSHAAALAIVTALFEACDIFDS
jgi:hypothetical protein